MSSEQMEYYKGLERENYLAIWKMKCLVGPMQIKQEGDIFGRFDISYRIFWAGWALF